MFGNWKRWMLNLTAAGAIAPATITCSPALDTIVRTVTDYVVVEDVYYEDVYYEDEYYYDDGFGFDFWYWD